MKIILYILIFKLIFMPLSAEIIIFKNCKSKNYDFEKNEYKLDMNKGLMTREFIYTDETYERLKLNDLRIKKKNTLNKNLKSSEQQPIP